MSTGKRAAADEHGAHGSKVPRFVELSSDDDTDEDLPSLDAILADSRHRRQGHGRRQDPEQVSSITPEPPVRGRASRPAPRPPRPAGRVDVDAPLAPTEESKLAKVASTPQARWLLFDRKQVQGAHRGSQSRPQIIGRRCDFPTELEEDSS